MIKTRFFFCLFFLVCNKVSMHTWRSGMLFMPKMHFLDFLLDLFVFPPRGGRGNLSESAFATFYLSYSQFTVVDNVSFFEHLPEYLPSLDRLRKHLLEASWAFPVVSATRLFISLHALFIKVGVSS